MPWQFPDKLRFGEHVDLYPSLILLQKLRWRPSCGISIANFLLIAALNPNLLLPSGAIWNCQESLTAENSCSNVGGNSGLTQIKYPSAVDSEDDATDCASPVQEQLSRALFNYQMTYLQR